jgi:competence ComEA-like helix-hairpin-helix protein
VRRTGKIVKDRLRLSATERRGMAVLLVFLLLVIAFNIFYPRFNRPERIDFGEFRLAVDSFIASTKENRDSAAREFDFAAIDESVARQKLHPFPFNPNNLPDDQWRKMGLTDRQVRVIRNYEKKGGKFYRKEDLAKIYSISRAEYAILEPFIRIPDQEVRQHDEEASLSIKPFPFDPNEVSEEQWREMGLRDRLVQTIMNYRGKGGKFYKKEDLKKIYGMREEEYLQLEPYVLISVDSNHRYGKEGKVMGEDLMVELNAADTLDLQQLKGIGPAFARRIVRYRDKLGGYYRKEQLLEVYGMEAERYDGIRDHVTVDAGLVRKININKATIKEMLRHPYMEFYIAKAIVNYRVQKGPFTDVGQIREAETIYDEVYERLAPYLTVE